MPKFKLDLADSEIRSDELLAIAIHSPGIPFYTLAHFLNKSMGWDLINIQELYYPEENPSCLLNVLSHMDELSRVQYFLIENQSGNQHLWIPKTNNVDHWIVVTGEGLSDSRIDVDHLLEQFAETENVFDTSILPFDTPSGRISPLFKYFQSLYDFLDDKGFILRFE